MGRKPELSIVNVFTWFSNVVDTQELKLGDIGLLMHIIKNLNRNFWKPLKMSVYKIAKNSGCDDRTVRSALKRLAEKNILLLKNGDKFDRIENPSEYFASKKFRQSDTTNYYSIFQKDGEIFFGIETQENRFAKSSDLNEEHPAQTSSNADSNVEQHSKVKTLANFL